ncbi:TonB-dependent receptor plug domain-containing protein [Alloacidobacterium sp.]|uniref:TonB-dependent receptor plug domain-containing protein n=1 Tax=Alloacidobacterium sp. TaxID=2951999 RepID=UPI002D3C60AD|nr:TonB-dependent receptor plug domain-containing protein [Alloacidobacterium sp.]HYK36077.1 TonB-dependent receptor plug domain-containing protein [Alloacidobacterium sp.]
MTANIALALGAATNTVVVTGVEDLVENDSTMHTNIDRGLIERLPLESASSSVSSLVTLASPGVTADSNGMFHGMGDHAENSFSVDGQPITDQQSKVFSNQIPSNSIQSMEVIDGAPPAEYGDKTSLVIKVTTRSGQGMTRPTGSIHTSYGAFGTATGGFDLGYGKANRGNFITADGLSTGRFLDPPEFKVFHAKGNGQNIFDRIDDQFTENDSIHLNLNYTRSWFQTPNAYDNLNVLDQFGNSVGETDQKSRIETFNISPTYTRLLSQTSVFNLGAFVRKDAFNYFPSENLFADLGPIQSESVGQRRTLLNTGLHSDISYVRGIHNFKAGAIYEHTILRENDVLGIVNPTLNSPCLDAEGNSVIGFTDPAQCTAADDEPNPNFKCQLAALRSDSKRWPLWILRTHRREAVGHVCRGPDYRRQLALRCRHSWRFVQRAYDCTRSAATGRSFVQHQEDEHGAARVLWPLAGDAFRRKPRPIKPRLLRCRAFSAVELHAGSFVAVGARLPQ